MQPSRLLLGARKLVAITSKRGNKNFYKGRGAPSTGVHTAKGGYKIDLARVASYTFIAPDLTNFPVSQTIRHTGGPCRAQRPRRRPTH